MVLLTVNGKSLHSPRSMSVSHFNLSASDSGRTQGGRMVNRIVAKKVSISCSWSGLTWEQISSVLTIVDETAILKIRYPDPKEGNFITKEFYISDRTSPMAVTKGDDIIWDGLSFEFIEI